MSQENIAPKRKVDFHTDVRVRTFFKPVDVFACTVLEPEFIEFAPIDGKQTLKTTEKPADPVAAARKKEKRKEAEQEAECQKELKKTISSIFDNLSTETTTLLGDIRGFLFTNYFTNVDESETYVMCSDTPVYKVKDPGAAVWAGPDRETAILSTFLFMDEDLKPFTVELRLVFPDKTLQGEPTVIITTNGKNVYHIPRDYSWDEVKEDITTLIDGSPDEGSDAPLTDTEENDAPPCTNEEEGSTTKRQRV
jgi:hypothetical protein